MPGLGGGAWSGGVPGLGGLLRGGGVPALGACLVPGGLLLGGGVPGGDSLGQLLLRSVRILLECILVF